MSGGNSGVESLPSKQMVAGSNPVPRSIASWTAQAVFELGQPDITTILPRAATIAQS
jgi:hypothetical protein